MGLINRILQSIVIGCIRFYRGAISCYLGRCCRFEPSCSCYAIAAIEKHGCVKGCYFSLLRLLRCHPWHPGGIDPIP